MTLPLTREQFEAGRARLKAKGIEVEGDEGILRHKGFVVNFSYAHNVLMLTVSLKPLLVPMSMVENKIKEWFEA